MIGLIPLPYRVMAVVAVVAIILAGAGLAIHDMKTRAYRAGVVATELTYERALSEANAANRQREDELRQDITLYADRVAELSAARRSREAPIVSEIEGRLDAQADCPIDPEIIRLRNELRAVQ